MAVKDMIRDAATLILAARTKVPSCTGSVFDYRILMLRRSVKSSFMPNNYVFPGGVIDKTDFSSEWMDLYQQSFPWLGKGFTALLDMKEPRPPVFQKLHNGVPSEIALRICAIRETFEESGILLLKSFGESGYFSNEDCSSISESESALLKSWRKEIHNDASKFVVMCRELQCVPDVWSLGEWSNWLTPPDLKKRFDTAFFICFVDHEPPVQHDNTETTHSQSSKNRSVLNYTDLFVFTGYEIPLFGHLDTEWVTPADAVMKHLARQIRLAPPQQYELLRFCRFPKWADFRTFQEERAKDGCEQFVMVRIHCADGEVSVLPHDDMHATLFKRHVLEEMAQQTGPVPIPQYPETVEQMRSKAKTLHRVELVKGSGSLQCNVTLGHGQCTPLTDPSRIMALASDLKSGL